MRRITKIICVVFLISLIVVSSLSASVSQEVRKQRMKSSVALFVGYQGVVDDENSIHGVTLGFHSKFHLFRLPLFYYVEGNVGYPFAFNKSENKRIFISLSSTMRILDIFFSLEKLFRLRYHTFDFKNIQGFYHDLHKMSPIGCLYRRK